MGFGPLPFLEIDQVFPSIHVSSELKSGELNNLLNYEKYLRKKNLCKDYFGLCLCCLGALLKASLNLIFL